VGSIGIKEFFVPMFMLVLLVQRKGVFELLCQVLIDGLTTLQNGSSVFEALYLLHDETHSIDLILLAAVDGDNALPIFFLLIRQDFDHGSSRPLDDISDHIAL
jgi:hypothetical protein